MLRREQITAPQSLCDQRRIVLRGDGDQHAAFSQSGQKLLVKAVVLGMVLQVPADAFHAHFAYDAAPEGIVQIRDKSLLRGWREERLNQELRQGVGVRDRVW